jgi:hypothetical protein
MKKSLINSNSETRHEQKCGEGSNWFKNIASSVPNLAPPLKRAFSEGFQGARKAYLTVFVFNSIQKSLSSIDGALRL